MKFAYHIQALFLTAGLTAAGAMAQPAGELPDAFDEIDVVERLEQEVPGGLLFTNSKGETVRLDSFFDGETPVVLNFVYHECPMLCSIVLDALTRGMSELAWLPGNEYEVLTVSISPSETPVLAAQQKQSFLRRLGRPEAARGWHFLVGEQPAIDALTEAVGFRYKWDARLQQYAHPAVLVFLSGDGRVMRYLYGIQYPAFQLRTALIEASEGKAGNAVERFIVSCYQYDPDSESYTPDIMRITRLVGGAFAILLAFGLFVFWRRETRRDPSEPQPSPEAHRE